MLSNFVVVNFKDYKPHIFIKDKWDKFPISNFTTTYSLDQTPSASVTIPYKLEDEENYINTSLAIKLKDKYIFNGAIIRSTYNEAGLTLQARGFSYFFQKIYNPGVVFDAQKDGFVYVSDAVKSIFNGTVSIQNLGSNIKLILDDKILKETLPIQDVYYLNLDNYTILKNLANYVGAIIFEGLDPFNGISILYFIKFSNRSTYITDYLNLDNNYFFERTKSYTGDGLNDSISIFDKLNDNSLTIYPSSKPSYIPSNTKVSTNDSIASNYYDKYLNKKIQSGIAIYDSIDYKGSKPEVVLKSMGDEILHASFLNLTSATFKLPGIQNQDSIISPGAQVGTTEYGQGILKKISYNFNSGILWETIEIYPMVS